MIREWNEESLDHRSALLYAMGVSPEAYEGSNLALIENGDMAHIDIEARSLTVDVSVEEFERRRASWKPLVKPAKGWLALYRKNCTSAHRGATVYWDV